MNARYTSTRIDMVTSNVPKKSIHRLWLDQPPEEIDARWRRGVRRHLLSTVLEFDPVRRAFLAARLKIPIDVESRTAARLEDWEGIVARSAAERLEDGDGGRGFEARDRTHAAYGWKPAHHHRSGRSCTFGTHRGRTGRT